MVACRPGLGGVMDGASILLFPLLCFFLSYILSIQEVLMFSINACFQLFLFPFNFAFSPGVEINHGFNLSIITDMLHVKLTFENTNVRG